MVFNIVTELYDHQHNKYNIFISLKGSPLAITLSLPPKSPVQVTTNLLLVSRFAYSGHVI